MKNEPLVKIGVSEDPRARLSQMNTANPFAMTLLGYIEGGYRLEKEIHDRFRYANSSGEWFLLVEELDDYIHEVLNR